MDGFQDKAAVEAPGECAEVAWQMFGVDHTMRGQEAVLDIGQHCVRPAEGRVARSGAIGAGDMSLMKNARLLGNAAKPLAAIANDGGSGRDTRTQPLGFAGLEPAHDLEAGVQWPAVRGGLDRNDERRVAAPAAPDTFAGALAADIGVVDLDPRTAGTKRVTALALDHGLHQLVLDPPGGIGRDPQPPAQLEGGHAFLALRAP